MKKLVLIFFVLLALSSFVYSQTEIQEVDFKNFTYEPYCAGQETRNITIKDRVFYEETKTEEGFTNRFYFNVFQIKYGDVDGNNSDEAVILTICNTGGTGNFTEGFIYGMKDGQPTLMTRIEGGDRAYGGLRDVSIENGKIVKVERSSPGDDGAACCPEKIETTIYRFENNQLEQVGEKNLKDIYPAERVEFDDGKSSKLLKVRLNNEDQIKRFVVRAKKGQTLELITSSNDVKVRLHKGKAKIQNVDEKQFRGTYATNEFVARLKESGDFVFELSNFSNIDMEFFVTVKIK